MMVETIKQCDFDLSKVSRLKQDDLVDSIKPSRARKVNFAISEVSFKNEDIMTIYNKWRALEKIHVPFQDTKIIFKELEYPLLEENTSSIEVGTMYAEKNNLYVKCNGGRLKVTRLQMENKKEMSSADFINGNRSKLPMILP